MKRIAITFASALFALALFGCASAPTLPYPPLEGTWMYDFAASFDDSGQLEQVPEEWMTALKQDPDPTRDELMVLRDPPQFILVERKGRQLIIKGGGRFERVYFLDGVAQQGMQVTITPTSIVAVHSQPEMTQTESWELSRDLSTLTIRVQAESPKLPKPLDMRRVYRSSRTF